ncbi:nuclear transport factor 2 family protein [Pusillimonas sp. SM2304]|uniref:nuclear transport factor 2 family protein n=1 Tax=Pusillimonas sp. SM2304 TaxID=3073241 RepID=UPI0028741314|nr:nuclear transport factor 2 family protein [Pusillimonas sp. SM2304]MDS1138820.1 nuclear transport factor 2 family protein [Pusillimonas sp. SM2304]
MSDDLSLCTNQIMAFFRDLDDREYARLTERLSAQATWHRQGQILKGRAAVHDALAKRSPTLRIHHLITNVMADHIDGDECHMRAYMLVVRHDDGKKACGPAPLSGIENIRTTHVKLERDADAWLIVQMRNDDPSFSATS